MSVPKEFSKLFDSKKVYKQQCASQLTLPFSHQQPIVGFCAETEKDLELLQSFLDGISAMKFPLILFWKGSKKPSIDWYDQVAIVTPRDAHYETMWRACDTAYCFTEEDVAQSFESGVVPLAPKGLKGTENYDPNKEKGNSFIYEGSGPWVMFSSLVRAAETFKFPFDWKCIVRNAKR